MGPALLLSLAICVTGIVRTRNRNEDWMSDETLFESNIRACPESAKGHQQLGMLRMNQKRFREAYTLMETARDIDPEWCEPYLHLGKLDAHKNNLGGALRNLRHCVSCPFALNTCFPLYYEVQKIFMTGNNATAWAAMGDVLQECQQFPEAQTHFREAGVIALRANDEKQAKRYFKRVLKMNPKSEDAHYWLGKTYQSEGNPKKAEKAFDLSLEYGSPTAVSASGEELVALLSQEADAKPNDHQPRIKIANVIWKMLVAASSRYEAAEKALESGSDPKETEQNFKLVQGFRSLFASLSNVHNQNAHRAALLSMAKGELGTAEGALRDIQRVVTLLPSTLVSEREEAEKWTTREGRFEYPCLVNYLLARVHDGQGRSEEATEYMELALDCPEVAQRARQELEELQ